VSATIPGRRCRGAVAQATIGWWLTRIVALAFAATGAGCHTPQRLETLATPALVWSQNMGNCGKTVAIDARGTVWTERGCENGALDLHAVRTIDEEEVERLWTMFDVLPPAEDASFLSCHGSFHEFSRWEADTRTGTGACGDAPVYDEPSGLPDAFRPLATALVGLE
jgi:hypothetical protein